MQGLVLLTESSGLCSLDGMIPTREKQKRWGGSLENL
jgi:hypothetical protein